eukprot:1686700-Amphidinium_carterae.1
MKRAFVDISGGGLGDHSAKAVKEQDDNNWVCEKCGNLNYGSRLVCNMRKCGASRQSMGGGAPEPEQWVCPGCGNENRAQRLF